jgi:hypothetical protein
VEGVATVRVVLDMVLAGAENRILAAAGVDARLMPYWRRLAAIV